MSEPTPEELNGTKHELPTGKTPHQAHLDAACEAIMKCLEKYNMDDRLFVLSHLSAYHIAPGQKVHEFKFLKLFDIHLKHHRGHLHQLKLDAEKQVKAAGGVTT